MHKPPSYYILIFCGAIFTFPVRSWVLNLMDAGFVQEWERRFTVNKSHYDIMTRGGVTYFTGLGVTWGYFYVFLNVVFFLLSPSLSWKIAQSLM